MSAVQQNVIIFGASGGIGSAVAKQLALSGHNPFLVGRSQEKLTPLANELNASHYCADATSSDQVEACFQAAKDRFVRIDGMVNCIGSLLLKPAHLTTDQEWASVITTNLTTSFITLRCAVNHLRPSGGSIVLVSSAAARRGLMNHEAIAAAKAGVIGLTMAAAASYAPSKIRVNCVAPGLVRTPLTASLIKSESFLKASTALHPLGRIGEPEEVASAITWLLSPRQGWVTGQTIGIDGGLSSIQARSVI